MDFVGERFVMPQQQRDELPRNPEGALYQPGTGGHVHGDHPGYVMKTSLYTRAARHPVLTGVLLAAAGAAAAALLRGGKAGARA
jgi:hypothetical protein